MPAVRPVAGQRGFFFGERGRPAKPSVGLTLAHGRQRLGDALAILNARMKAAAWGAAGDGLQEGLQEAQRAEANFNGNRWRYRAFIWSPSVESDDTV